MFLPQRFDSVNDRDSDDDHREGGGNVPGVGEVLDRDVPATTERVADAGDGRGKHGATDDGKREESPDGHIGESGDDGNERTEQRNEASDEDERLPPAAEECLGAVEVAMGKQQIPTDLVDEGPTTEAPETVPEERTDKLTDYRDDDYEPERKVVSRTGKHLATGKRSTISHGEL
jgi:hypothetical protein